VIFSLSVVVCTHDRPSDLERCLEALSAVSGIAEVITVDSGSEPPCRELVDRFSARIPRLTYVREEEPGLSRARNRGLTLAQGEIVAFVDDDAAPRRGWAEAIVARFAADPAIGCVGGACSPDFGELPRPHWLSDRLLQFAGITRFGGEAREARSSAEWPFGANIAFRARALAEAGGFSEKLGRTGATLLSGEESAVVEAVRRAGWTVWLEPEAIVEHTVHADRCERGYYWRRLWWAGVSRARSSEQVTVTAIRVVVAAPVRLCLYALTRDRVYLYRLAETAGYVREWLRPHREPA
jgi:GT2 family glycosyltransferase